MWQWGEHDSGAGPARPPVQPAAGLLAWNAVGGNGHRASARQLALPFAHRPRFERADFLRAPCNEAALRWLDRSGGVAWPQGRLALWGEAGSGKTHLLHVWAAEHDALLLPGTALRELALGGLALGSMAPGRLAPAHLAQGSLALAGRVGRPRRWRGIAVDDADEATDEAALLHLLNAAQEAGLPVLLTARAAPSRWNTRLPDLASRLRATSSVPIGQPDEPLLRILLLRLLVERQLVVQPPVVDWLLARLPRTAAAMRDAARALDEAALASGRRVTRALAAAVLEDPPAWLVEDAETPGDARLL